METIAIDGLHFDKRYAGIFVTKDINIATLIKRNLKNDDVSIWLYESPGFFLCIIIGNEHTESVIKWFQGVHDIAIGSSMLAAILANGRFQPSRLDNCFFRLQMEKMQPDILKNIIEEYDLFCLFLPHSMELCIFTDGLNCEKLLRYPNIPKPIRGLVLRETTEKSEIRGRLSKSYDPIGAQIGEILNRNSVAVANLIKDTANAWKNYLRTEPPSEFAYLEQAINRQIEYIRVALSQLQSDKSDSEDKKILFFEIDLLATRLKQISEIYAHLKDKLRDYQAPIDHWDFSTNYLELATPLVLRAAKQYIHELTDRAALSGQMNIIPIFGDEFSSQPLIHQGLLSSFSKTSNDILGKMKARIFSLPREMKLRIGSFPILAHEIGHALLENNNIIINEVALSILDGKYKTTFLGIFDHITKPKQLTKAASIIYKNNINIMFKWLNEILSDLIATALAGPAYIYAFARFATGTLHHYLTDDKKHYPTHPSIDIRILLCIEYLNSLGFVSSFASGFLKSTSNMMHNDLVEMIFSLVSKPYTLDQHSGISTIQQSLIQGNIIHNDPILILNALWDSVIDKKGYINEIAALLSLINHEIKPN